MIPSANERSYRDLLEYIKIVGGWPYFLNQILKVIKIYDYVKTI